MKCAALDWVKAEKDYVECSQEKAELCRMKGLLISVDVPLCRAHQDYFLKGLSGFMRLEATDVHS